MHVAALTAFHVRIPLRRTVRHASHVRTATDNLLVRCLLADGTTGWGEGVPREYVTGESAPSALSLLGASNLPGQLEPLRVLPDAVNLAERIQLARAPSDERGIGGNAARCAVELALLDAFTRHFRVPVSAVTRLVAPDLFQPRGSVRYSGAITSANGLKLKLLAWAYRLYGFRQIKMKVGISGQDDVRRLKAARRAVGARVELRIDANEAWPADEAAARIRELEPFGIDCVEQPVAHAEIAALTEIRSRIATPIMLDESLCGRADAERAVRERLCERFNLRLSKCGGYIPTLRLAQFARQNQITVQLGCQVGETAVLSAAGRHFAASVSELTAVEGSFDRHLVREPLGDRDLTFGRGGWAPALDGPGLGVAVDPASLSRVTISQEQLLG